MSDQQHEFANTYHNAQTPLPATADRALRAFWAAADGVLTGSWEEWNEKSE